MSAVDPTVHHARVGVSIDRNTLHGGLLATERWYNPVVTVAAAAAGATAAANLQSIISISRFNQSGHANQRSRHKTAAAENQHSWNEPC